jgi:2-keto-4-pentenoate hydratase
LAWRAAGWACGEAYGTAIVTELAAWRAIRSDLLFHPHKFNDASIYFDMQFVLAVESDIEVNIDRAISSPRVAAIDVLKHTFR